MGESNRPCRWVAVGAILALACLLFLSRALIAPANLYYFDSVNFALALKDFNPAMHQPQPPGYPLFVLLARFVFLFVDTAQSAFVIAGIFGSAAVLCLVWLLGREMFDRRAAWCAVLLLLFNPPFWFGAVTNQVRVFLALAAAVVMLSAWRSLGHQRPKWFYLSAALLGALAGFRPEVLVFGSPILIYAGARARRPLSQWLIAIGAGSVTTLAWLGAAVVASGGLETYLRLLREYSDAEFSATSVVFGADSRGVRRMLTMALVWYGVPLLTWLYAIPFAHGLVRRLHGRGAFLAVVVFPAFLFHAVVHVGDPDHTLFAVPALCLLGGLVLSLARRAVLVTGTAVLLNFVVFFSPPKGIAQACSYRAVHHVDQLTRDTFSAIRSLQKEGPVAVVAYDHPITWRHVSYYFPEIPLIVLRDNPNDASGPASVWLIQHGRLQTVRADGQSILLPDARRAVWMLSRGRGMHRLLRSSADVHGTATVVYTELEPGVPLRFGRYQFVAGL